MQRSCARSRPAAPCAPPLRRPRSRCPAAVASSRRELYPELPSPRVVGTLAVDSPHFLYYEEHGNPGAPRPQQRGDDPLALRFLALTRATVRAAGVPALVVHGGPGAGCFATHARFFDPKRACSARLACACLALYALCRRFRRFA